VESLAHPAGPVDPSGDRPGLGAGLAAAGADFVAMLSPSNMLGRFIWSSTSDMIGRRNIYQIV
jgi:hypothetical protein